mmetsp:Transcript_164122/g.526316  ORF Transcript_164122/g.526316 Transcript_164122/m.526316 type:complete len:200 (-) Transcript_164122:1109-1708(-)
MLKQSASKCRVISTSAPPASATSSNHRRASENQKVSKSKAKASIPKFTSRCTIACLCRMEPLSGSPEEPFKGSQHATLELAEPSAAAATSQACRQASPIATMMVCMPNFVAQAAKRGTRGAHVSPQTNVTATTLRRGTGRRQLGKPEASRSRPSASPGPSHSQPRSRQRAGERPEKPHSNRPSMVLARIVVSTASKAPV